MKLLLTGFEPWGKWDRNPAGEVAQSLAGKTVAGCEVVSAVLPVAHGEDIDRVVPLIETHRPAAVVSLGLGGRMGLNVERVAVNLKVVDGANGPVDLPVVEGGPAAYFSTLPTREMVARMRSAGAPAQLSYSAGTFLCNHIMYSVLSCVEEQRLDIQAGFIHIPPMPEQVVDSSRPGMALEQVRTGVVAGLEAVVGFLRKQSGVEVV